MKASNEPPKGENPLTDLFKTGQRVPVAGDWMDQYGVVTNHDAHATFPPCVNRKGECAYRRLLP